MGPERAAVKVADRSLEDEERRANWEVFDFMADGETHHCSGTLGADQTRGGATAVTNAGQ